MHNWEEINALHDLPKWNASSVKIEAGRRYALLSGDGQVVDPTQYTLTDIKEGKAVLEGRDGFSFRVPFDELGHVPPMKDEPLQQWSSKEIEVSTEEAKRIGNELAAKSAGESIESLNFKGFQHLVDKGLKQGAIFSTAKNTVKNKDLPKLKKVYLEDLVESSELSKAKEVDYKMLEALHRFNLDPERRNKRAYTHAREIQYTAEDMLDFAKLWVEKN